MLNDSTQDFATTTLALDILANVIAKETTPENILYLINKLWDEYFEKVGVES